MTAVRVISRGVIWSFISATSVCLFSASSQCQGLFSSPVILPHPCMSLWPRGYVALYCHPSMWCFVCSWLRLFSTFELIKTVLYRACPPARTMEVFCFFLDSYNKAYGHVEISLWRKGLSVCKLESEDEPKISCETVLDRNSQNENACRAQEETHDMMPFFFSLPEGPRETTARARRLKG